MAEYTNNVLVEPEWLEEHLEDDSIRIVEVDENPALYPDGHIPGAIGFDWRHDLQQPVRRGVLDPAHFGELLGAHGISNAHLVVVYGDRNGWFAAYAYWYLKYYGHSSVKLLNGPRERWIGEGRPITSRVPAHARVTYTAKPGDKAIRATRDEILSGFGTKRVLVDVRAPHEYAGEFEYAGDLAAVPVCACEGAQRSGHIPGAKSIPWVRAVREDGTFKAADDLRELYGAEGVLSGDPIISYCSIGERSAHTWFVLHELLGQREVKNYEGSWAEWGNLVDVPIEVSGTRCDRDARTW